MPSFSDLLWPVIGALRSLGGSASIDELLNETVRASAYPPSVQDVPHGTTGRSELEYRLAWARTYLKFMGLAKNSDRGVWSLTDEGSRATSDHVARRYQEFLLKRRQDRRQSRGNPPAAPDVPDEADDAWIERLLDRLLTLSPDQFERLSQRLLREAGFINTTVTGRSGDGGIDGIGVYRLSLVSFPIFFQCKRYRGSVGAGAVRDFRGAMAGRGDKGLLITTGNFTGDAKREATRMGATPIDVIDGQQLAGLLKQFDLGVRTTTRTVEEIAIDHAFFAAL